MFCNKPKGVNRNVPGKKNRKRKKKSPYPQGEIKLRNTNQSHLNIAHAMSNWAQNYTAATSWHLKHQIAYWKSKAVALQYENKVLHDIIKEQHFKQGVTSEINSESSDSDEEVEDVSDENENSSYEEDENVDDAENENFEVSEEFIEFLKENAKYKEDARKEREKFKAKQEAESREANEEALETSEQKQARFKEMYGANWEKIMALETYMVCDFISECDKLLPEYWPNIPFNL